MTDKSPALSAVWQHSTHSRTNSVHLSYGALWQTNVRYAGWACREPSSHQELTTNWSWEGWSAPGDHIYHRRTKIKTACSFNCLLKSELSLPRLRPQDSALVKITGRMSLEDYERVPVLFSEERQMALIVAYVTTSLTVHCGPEVLFITFTLFTIY